MPRESGASTNHESLLFTGSPAFGPVKKLAPQARCSLLRPLPLAGEGNSLLPSDEWVRGLRANPSPIRDRGHILAPSPAGGEGTRGNAAPAARFLHRLDGGQSSNHGVSLITGCPLSRGMT